jgi:hypothetical protein
MTSPTVRRGAPLAAGVAVLALVGGSAYLLRDDAAGPGSSTPPPLRIGAGVAAADSVADLDRVIVSGDLPDGPADARVHRFGSADPEVSRLADALGVDEAAVRNGEGLPAGSGTVLRVGTALGGPWQFARADAYVCQDALVGENPEGSVSSTCAAPPQSARPAVADPPTEAAARDAARPVLEAVGLDIGAARVDPSVQDTRTVRVDPDLDGLPTSGLATTVTVDADGVLTASGWLGEARPSDTYPVVSAKEAVARLASMPMPLIGCAENATPVPPGPVCGGPLEVTGATFGMSVQWEGEQRAVLVPSWLFDIKGNDQPLPVVAVDPSYLADPLPVDQPGDGTSGSGSGMPGSPGTADPGSRPVAPKVEPSAATSRFDSLSVVQGGAALQVTFYGGVDSCYSYEVEAKESADQVSLRLIETRHGDVCIDLAQQYERTIELDEPLGNRRVIDADTKFPLYPRG